MARCHAEIYHKNGTITKCAYWNGEINSIKQQSMRQAQMIFNQENRPAVSDSCKPTHIQIVVDNY